jgi:hypothetical protein
MSVGWCETCQRYAPGSHPCFQQPPLAAPEDASARADALCGEVSDTPPTSAEAMPDGWTINVGAWKTEQRGPIPAEAAIYERGGFVPPTPAAMLGEALEVLWRAETLVRGAVGTSALGDLDPVAVAEMFSAMRLRVSNAKRDAEAREGESRARDPDFLRYGYLSSDPTRTDDEDAEMQRLKASLESRGFDLGLPPVAREGQG